MLDRVQITNFQKHKFLKLKPNSGITAIVGPSDAGKSSVVRALRWLALNKPRGKQFIHDGEEEASVKVRIDGKTVERRRGETNQYRLGKQIYTAFGNSVPEPISNLLRLGAENFQGQHEGPFWFGLSGGELAARLNEVVDLTIIDETLAKIAKRVREAKTAVDVAKNKLEEAREERKRLKFSVLARVSLDRIEGLSNTAKQIGTRCDRLHDTIEQYEQLSVLAGRKSPSQDFKRLEEGAEQVRALKQRTSRLAGLVESAEQTIREIDKGEEERDSVLRQIQEGTKGFCPICGQPFELEED